jgi:CelD/BcsL family acetyltransferase involved in cellulose biosynthesis
LIGDGDRTIGGLLGFRTPTEFAYYQLGWSPEWRSYSLGSVLVGHAILWARAQGLRTFDFLRGRDEYKYRFGAVDRRDGSVVLGHGLGGLLLEAREQARRIRTKMR